MPTKKEENHKTLVIIYPDGKITVEKTSLDDFSNSYVLAKDGIADKD